MKTQIEELGLGIFHLLLLKDEKDNGTSKETRNAWRFGNLTWHEVNR
jgi:hypothetical protein